MRYFLSLAGGLALALALIGPALAQPSGRMRAPAVDQNNTYTGTNTYSGTTNFDGPVDMDSTLDLSGSTVTMPATQTITTLTTTTHNGATETISTTLNSNGATNIGNEQTDTLTITGLANLDKYAQIGIPCRNETGGGLGAGDVVTFDNSTGWTESNTARLVKLADNNANLIGHAVLTASLANNTTGTCYLHWRSSATLATNGTTVGDPVYLSATATTGNTWTFSAPTAANAIGQKVGYVAVVHATTGVIVFDFLPPRIYRIGTNEIQLEAVSVNEMADLARGSILTGQTAGNRPAALDANDSGKILVGDGTDLVSVAVSGDVTLAANGAVDIAADVVGNTELGPYQVKTLCFLYDFTVLGGAQGAKTMTRCSDGAAQTIPDNSAIVRVIQESDVDATSGGAATIELGYTGNTNAFLTAAAYTDASFDVDIITARAQETPIMTGAAVSVLNTIGAADLTAGKFKLYVDYYEGD